MDFSLIIDALPQIVWTAPPDGEPNYFNQRWFEYTGLNLFQSQGFAWCALVHADDQPGFLKDWREAIRQGSPFRLLFRLKRASDGVFRWHVVHGQPLKGAAGKILQWVGTCEDIEERARAEEALKRTAVELARSNAELEQFASVASHDLQEPLRMVASATQLLARDYKDKLTPDMAEWLAYARDGAKRMQVLINALLDYARLNLRKEPFQTVGCQRACELALANLKVPLDESGGSVEVESLPCVMGNEAQLVRLFQNLLANAIKFRGPQPLRVHVSATHLEDHWHFTVRDNGIGIDPKQFHRLFVLFQRLHPTAEYPGTGLGLAICKKIVEQHGGRIWVDSAPGQGAAFHFTLPLPASGDATRSGI